MVGPEPVNTELPDTPLAATLDVTVAELSFMT